MRKINVYRFQVYDSQTDMMQTSRRWGTKEAVAEITRGKILEGTGIEVDQSAVDSDIPGLTHIDFNPNATLGFQRTVK